MAKSWLIDGKTIARSVKTSGLHSAHDQIKDCGASWECPHCSCIIDNSDGVRLMVKGGPRYKSIQRVLEPLRGVNGVAWATQGVKFDPSDVELLEHLAAKCGVGKEKPHPYLDEFIPTLDAEEGICYQHPKNLPGSRKDGNSFYFFYRNANAYTTGKRKRRKISTAPGSTTPMTSVRWHKTGTTKPIFKNVAHQIGCKKIMVLYQTSSDDGATKHSKTNWVMHQYHLGTDEDEKDDEYVVSKIFYQPKTGRDMGSRVVGPAIPATPKADARDPPRPVKGECDLGSAVQESKCFEPKNGANLPTREDAFHNTLFGQYNVDAYCPLSESTFIEDTSFEAIDLENLEVDTPPEFDLADLYFPSEDSAFGGMESFSDTCGFSD